MAKKQSDMRKVLLLIDCEAGKSGQVVELKAAEVAELVAAGVADSNPGAVAARN